MNAKHKDTDFGGADIIDIEDNLLSEQVAEESAMAHRNMRRYFESIERAIESDNFEDGAKLLSELIRVARDHFTTKESIARAGGKSHSAGGRLLHTTFVSRARSLQERCESTAASPINRENICNELVMLLCDIVESDLRIQRRIDDCPDISGR